MSNFWKSLLASLPPSWRIWSDPSRREALLKFLLVVAIMLSAGPEIVTAMEMRFLLEILGATLFMTVFVAGARFTYLVIGENIRNVLLAGAPAALIFIAYADWWLGTAAACITSAHSLLELVP